MSTITYEMIPVNDLKIERYNRLINVARAKMYAANYNESEMGVITVSKRDGNYHIIDGQHRTYVAAILKIPAIMCVVHEGLTYEQEADLFIKLNKNRVGLLIYDYYKAAKEGGDKRMIEIDDAINSLGLHVARGTTANGVQAISCVLRITNEKGIEHLKRVLSLIKRTWEGHEKSFGQDIVWGTSTFLTTYDNLCDDARFCRISDYATPDKIKAQANSDMSAETKKVKIAKVLLYYYNHKLTKYRLPNKF